LSVRNLENAMTEAYLQLVNTVDTVRRAWRTRRMLEGMLLACSIVLGILIAAGILDQLAHFGPVGRWVLGIVFWGGLIACVWRLVARPAMTGHSDDFFAALLEGRLPELRNRFINALQLGREEHPAAPKLIDAIVTDGVRATDEIDPGRAVTGPALRRHGLALGVVLVVAIAWVLIAGPAARAAMARVLLPGSDVPPFTWTRLSVDLDPGQRLLEGRSLTVTASVDTDWQVPETATVRRTNARGEERAVAMQSVARGKFAHTFRDLESDFRFHVTAGDARSDSYRVVVDDRPRVESIAVTYRYPEYTGIAERAVDDFDGHLHGLPQTTALLTFRVNKALDGLTLNLDGKPLATTAGDDELTWQTGLTLEQRGTYRAIMHDPQWGEIEEPTTYTITLETDAPPAVAFARPARDIQLRPDGEVGFTIVAQDDYGLGDVRMLATINNAEESTLLQQWPAEGEPKRRVEFELRRTVDQLGMTGGDRMEYWAVAFDRNNIAADGPGRAETRKFNLVVLTAEQARQLLEKQLSDYARVIGELIRLQRQNRAETAEHKPAASLVNRQSMIRRQTIRLADVMERNTFPATTIIEQLRELGGEPMPKVITLLESYRDALTLSEGKPIAEQSLPIQDEIIAALEEILLRLNRADQVRQRLKKARDAEPAKHREVTGVLEKLAKDLDEFLNEIKEIEEDYEKMPQRRDPDELSGEDLANIDDIEHRLDRWKKWSKDTVDGLVKLPDGFVPDAFLSETMSIIFEEIEKQERKPTTEIATPVEEGIKALAEEVAEDLEMWMPHAGDSTKWVMEDPMEGAFDVPEAELPSNLQDMIGDLVEDVEDFDEQADDITGAWGGNMQVGWEIGDGPISSYYASGKTGNQLPNSSEMGGRSGSGRRGRATGQMVGAESRALEGRPTPARLTNEQYEEGVPEAGKQLDPRGSTGGGKKTGGGRRGLQGNAPPDFVKDMERLQKNMAMLREQAQQVARQLDYAGRPLGGVQRAITLMEAAEQDYRDLRYDDAARKRKMALGQLRAGYAEIDQAVNLSMQKAPNLPQEMREEISSGVQQALPEGYEDIVGEYYKAISRNAGE